MKSRKSYCTTVGVGVGVGVGVVVAVGVGISKMLKFYVKVFYVMGKALSGKLSCPCDRSCLPYYVTMEHTVKTLKPRVAIRSLPLVPDNFCFGLNFYFSQIYIQL